MSYELNQDKWSAKVAAYVTIARETLPTLGMIMKFHEFVIRLLHEEDIDAPDIDSAWKSLGEDRIRVAEISYLAMEALNRMVADGELVSINPHSSPPYFSQLAAHLGWADANTLHPSPPQAVRPTVRFFEQASVEWPTLTSWGGVDALARESRAAYNRGLYIAAAATARVAAEQAVLESLTTLTLSDEGKAASRENRLFAELGAKHFHGLSLDHSATKAQLSAVRTLGNTAAHEGYIDNLALAESLTKLLPLALNSLFKAVLKAAA